MIESKPGYSPSLLPAMRRLFCLTAAALGLVAGDAARAQSYGFTTAAGVAGTGGSTDGTNSLALFREPGGVAVDAAGNIYIADTANHVIRKATPLGNSWAVTTIAGEAGASGTKDGTNNGARFFFPYGIAVDGQANLYVADTYNNTIRKITPMGTNWVVTTFAGTAGSHGSSDGAGYSAGFYLPYGVAADSLGNVVVADTYNHTIRLLVPVGTNCMVTTLAGAAGTNGMADGSNSVARFDSPGGVALTAGTNIYVADTYNHTVRRVTPVGTNWVVSTLAGFADFFGGFADGTNSAAQFDFPFGLAVDASTNIYVADTDNEAIRKISPVGTNWVVGTIGGLGTVSGASDGVGTAARFASPQGVSVDPLGNLYIADTSNNTLRFGRLGFALQASLIGGQLVLSWPITATNYVLQTKSPLTSVSWTPITTGIFVVGTNYVKTNSVPGPSAYYRLRK